VTVAGIQKAAQLFFAYTEQPTDAVGPEFATSNQAANRLVADVQPTRHGWYVKQLTSIVLRTWASRP
jgi:hypothetical protein